MNRKLSMLELNRLTPTEYKAQEKTPIVLVLDNIRSALNVGSAFRTADSFALQGIYLCGITATPPHREILKTAIGATASVDWQYFETTKTAVEHLKNDGFNVFAVEQVTEKTWLQDVKTSPDEKYALIFGNEVKGVSNSVLPLVDGCIEIPQFGTKHSLNISVSVGIVVWEFFRELRY
ncbi:MAG: RNA methyltransferase [Saprospiraceae bacterium]